MPESRGSRVFHFLNTSKSFPKWSHHFILAATVREMPGSSASLPARGAAPRFNYRRCHEYPERCLAAVLRAFP